MLHCPYDGYRLRRVVWGGYQRVATEVFYAFCRKHRFRISITGEEIKFEPLTTEEWIEARYDYDAVEPRGG